MSRLSSSFVISHLSSLRSPRFALKSHVSAHGASHLTPLAPCMQGPRAGGAGRGSRPDFRIREALLTGAHARRRQERAKMLPFLVLLLPFPTAFPWLFTLFSLPLGGRRPGPPPDHLHLQAFLWCEETLFHSHCLLLVSPPSKARVFLRQATTLRPAAAGTT